MYKAIKKIGEYEIGDEVPTEKAIIWLKMYAEPHVAEVGNEAVTEEVEEISKETVEESEESDEIMLDDYLGRNTNVVVKNIEGDNLGIGVLKSLLRLEKSGKKRKAVIKSIQKELA